MKPLFFILSFFILYLSCLPCNDNRECNAKTEFEIKSNNNHQKHEHQSEACTPFCNCSCCAASAFFYPLTKIQASKIVFLSEKYPLLNIDAHTEVYLAIWQPPKLS